LLDLLGKGIEAGDLAHVELEKVGLATEGGNLLEARFGGFAVVAVGKEDVVTGGGELEGGIAAEPPTASGDDGYF
ncbi:MAG: hypothetical protein AAF723_02220, partial [Pseudomonadota bacterium]